MRKEWDKEKGKWDTAVFNIVANFARSNYVKMIKHLQMKPYLTILTAGMLAMTAASCRNEGKKEAVEPIRVETAVVTKSAVDASRVYSGVIEESSGTALSFKVAGTIVSLPVTEGQRVAKGQLIASLDGASLQSNYEIAKSALATAQDTYNRMKQLHESNSIPEMKWVEVENALQAAKSTCEIAKNALNDTRLYAPFSGIISEKFTDAGSTAAPAVPIVKLVEISPVKASISVAENEIGDFTPGSTAIIGCEAAGGLTVEGKMTERGVAADPLSRTYTVKFTAANPDGKLLPGMLCNVSLKSQGGTEAIVIPVEAVLLGHDNNSFVWAVNNGKAVKRTITLGAYTATGVIAASGLASGDSIIVAGQQKVSDGMNVTPINR